MMTKVITSLSPHLLIQFSPHPNQNRSAQSRDLPVSFQVGFGFFQHFVSMAAFLPNSNQGRGNWELKRNAEHL